MNKRGLFTSTLALSLLFTVNGGITTYASKVDDIKIDSDVVAFVGDDFLSIRENATSSSKEIGRLVLGASAIKTGNKSGDWIEVKSGGITGWVYEPYVISKNKLSSYILNNLGDFNVNVQPNKATGQYTSIKGLKNDILSYSTKVTLPSDNVILYKTKDLTVKSKDKFIEKKKVKVTHEGVRLRKKDSKKSRVLDIVDSGKKFELISKKKKWYKVKYGDNQAYISEDLCKVISKKVKASNIANVSYKINTMYDAEIINKNTVKVSIENKEYYAKIDDTYVFYLADEDSNAISIGGIQNSYRLKSINKKDNVYKIEETNDLSGSSVDLFMNAKDSDLFVDFEDAIKINDNDDGNNAGDTDSKDINFIPKSTMDKYIDKYHYDYANNSTDLRNSIVNFALQFLGNPYVYGGTSITNGIDCSAYVQYILMQYGISIGRSTGIQVSESAGRDIDAKDIQPGDLIYYTRDGKHPYHVVMYLGGDKCINASNETWGICISTIQKDRILKVKNYID